MERGHYGEYSGNARHSRLKQDMIHERELIHDAKNEIHNEDQKYHAASRQGVNPDFRYDPVVGSDQNLDNSAEARFDSQYGMSPMRMSALKNRYTAPLTQSDRPSYTREKTSQQVTPGTTTSVETAVTSGNNAGTSTLKKARGGSTKTKLSNEQYMTNLSNSDKFKGKTGIEMAEANYISKSKIGQYDKIAGTSSQAGSTSSTSTVTTEPKIETVVKKDEIVSKNLGSGELLSAGQEVEKNRQNRYKAGRDERVNIAKKDSADAAQKYLKNRPINERNLVTAVQRGNDAGRSSLQGSGNDRHGNSRGSFNEKNYEFRFSRDEANAMFSRDIGRGRATVTDASRSKAKVGDDIPVSGGSYQGGRFLPSDVGGTANIGKKGKGKATVTSVNVDPGTAGSYGGHKTPDKYFGR